MPNGTANKAAINHQSKNPTKQKERSITIKKFTAMKTYKQKKEEVRQQAIEWHNNAAAGVLHWTSVFWGTLYFEQKGRRYGLLTEFKENGII